MRRQRTVVPCRSEIPLLTPNTSQGQLRGLEDEGLGGWLADR